MSTKENVQKLQEQLNAAFAQRAQVDEQILGLRQTIQGINLGVELQKEIVLDEAREADARKQALEIVKDGDDS